MIIKSVTLEAVGVVLKQYPETGLPELCIAGRSNVGKSSLINALVGRKSLARTSQTPGKTRTINFYNVNNLLYLVDLPGYGFSRAGKAEAAKWGKMIEAYLQKREVLHGALLLVDSRHEPQPLDYQMADYFRYFEIPFFVAATKTDKLGASELQKNLNIIRKKLELNEPPIPTSSSTKAGIDKLWERLLADLPENSSAT